MQKTSTVTVPFMLLGILFNICLVASNLLETKVIQVFGITATAGLYRRSMGIQESTPDYLERVRFEFPGNRICPTGGDAAGRSILGRRRGV